MIGFLSVAAGIALAELSAAIIGITGPVLNLGSAIIDATPTPVKEWAVRSFGTADKTILLASVAVALGALAAAVGLVSHRHRGLAVAALWAFAAVGAAVSLTRPAADAWAALPPLIGALTGTAVLGALSRARAAARPGGEPGRAARRRFLITSAAVAAGTLAGGAGARLVSRARAAGETSRAQVRLPAPASPAGPRLAEGFYTPNRDFYRVDTALSVPQVDAGAWRLRVHGLVGAEREYTFAELLARPLIERDVTLVCVSNEVGGPYLGTARWLGVPLAELLAEAGVALDADQIVARSADGMTFGTPTRAVTDGRDAMIALGMNGEPLPLEHGFPARMLVPGLYGYVSACKWITELEASRFGDFDPYWVRRDWAREAPVKTSSRIDAPRALAAVPAGRVRVAGVAWAPHRGVRAVEVRVDGGEWRPAALGASASADTWAQWTFDWDATPGRHDLAVRATDGSGAVQDERRAAPFPDGATGWHSIAVRVS
ncbi:molybdopterin-dependent oxidoreductase [Actinorhabdospora filicis]|nr:molybdopterin-dependent oxidoreductase [Actinorhabdospora filicis]